MLSSQSPWFIAVIAALVAVGAISTDLYLPALPVLTQSFATDIDRVQLTLSSYLAGFAVFHLICGPLSDRYGRRPIIIWGLVIYIIATALCALSQSINQLILCRFLQAMGACVGPTLGRAIVRDRFEGEQAAKALGYVATVMALAPVAAPILGGQILLFLSWQYIFVLLLCYGVVVLLLSVFLIEESLPLKQGLELSVLLKNYRALFSNRDFLGYSVSASLLYCGAFAFLSGSSFVLVDFMGVSLQHFGWYFVWVVSGYMVGSLGTTRLVGKLSARQIMLLGIGLGLSAAMLMVTLLAAGLNHPFAVVLPVAALAVAVGLTMPQAMMLAMQPFPQIAGSASALLGFIQMSLASAVGVVVGLLLEDSALPMALVILACTVGSLLSYCLLLGKADLAGDPGIGDEQSPAKQEI